MDAASAGLIAAIVTGLLCLRRRRYPQTPRVERMISDEEMQTYSRLSAESQTWGDAL